MKKPPLPLKEVTIKVDKTNDLIDFIFTINALVYDGGSKGYVNEKDRLLVGNIVNEQIAKALWPDKE